MYYVLDGMLTNTSGARPSVEANIDMVLGGRFDSVMIHLLDQLNVLD